MARRLCGAVALLGLVAGAVAAQAQSQPKPMPMSGMEHAMDQPAPPAGPLTISYNGQSAEWTAATLAALPHTTVTVYNEHVKANQTYSGVPLMELLARLGAPKDPRGHQMRFYLEAVGSDGYVAVYSLAEVNPDVHDATVIVADSEGGKPIGRSGPLQLVDSRDKRPARWVRNLVAIRVLPAE